MSSFVCRHTLRKKFSDRTGRSDHSACRDARTASTACFSPIVSFRTAPPSHNAAPQFQSEKKGEEIEADLALFIKRDRFGRTTIETLFAECKTYSRFKRKDINR